MYRYNNPKVIVRPFSVAGGVQVLPVLPKVKDEIKIKAQDAARYAFRNWNSIH